MTSRILPMSLMSSSVRFLLVRSFPQSLGNINRLTCSRLEERRETVRRPDVDLETQLAEADTRRKEMEQQRIQKLSLLSGADKIEKVGKVNLSRTLSVLVSYQFRPGNSK